MKYTKNLEEALKRAKEYAVEHHHGFIGTEHLMYGMLSLEGTFVSTLMAEWGVPAAKYKGMLDQMGDGSSEISVDPDYSLHARDLLAEAEKCAEAMGVGEAGCDQLLLVLLSATECVGSRYLAAMGLSPMHLADRLRQEMGLRDPREMAPRPNVYSQDMYPEGEEAQGEALPRFSRDLTSEEYLAKADPMIGREKEISRLIQILCRRTKNNPVLIGEAGVGKSAIVTGLARRIYEGNVPPALQGKRILSLDMAGMVAGTKYRGEFEARIKKCLDEIKADPSIILFMDELHTLIGAGGAEGSMDAANMLKPALSRGEIKLIGATTVSEYSKKIEKDAALVRRFQPILVEETTEEETLKILEGIKDRYEAHHGVIYTEEALKAAVTLSKRYVNDRCLPDKAIDLLDEAGARLGLNSKRTAAADTAGSADAAAQAGADLTLEEVTRLKQEAVIKGNLKKAAGYKALENELKKNETQAATVAAEKTAALTAAKAADASEQPRTVTEEDMTEVVALWTGIPLERLSESESEKLLHLEDRLHQRVVGQDEAVSALSQAIRRSRLGLKDPKRPIGSFLFLGPTGVGKTELAKALAECLFGSEEAMVRLDMSEYMDKISVSKLIGSAPGYVGYDEGGQLTEIIRKKPYAVVLFDEIEKANPDVFNVLLQVLDDGRITDARGRKADFKNTVIIMTSNTGARSILTSKQLGFATGSAKERDYEHMKTQVMEEVKRTFRPEFINRIDETIVFHTLTEEEIGRIAGMMFDELAARLKESRDVTLKLSDEARSYLVKKGYDPSYGARPLRRLLQSELENALADGLLSGKITAGQTLVVTAQGGRLEVELGED